MSAVIFALMLIVYHVAVCVIAIFAWEYHKVRMELIRNRPGLVLFLMGGRNHER